MKERVKECINQVVLKAAKKGANSVSDWGFYQPKEPIGFKKLKKR